MPAGVGVTQKIQTMLDRTATGPLMTTTEKGNGAEGILGGGNIALFIRRGGKSQRAVVTQMTREMMLNKAATDSLMATNK